MEYVLNALIRYHEDSMEGGSSATVVPVPGIAVMGALLARGWRREHDVKPEFYILIILTALIQVSA
ncbi:MAG: hypothetical protein ACPLJI_07770 [Methanothermobacter sp.]|uniref:hypothetical protein n=1 Tax=Methanothermobacter sp. TaxID=1884223 RepID=UPI003C749D39